VQIQTKANENNNFESRGNNNNLNQSRSSRLQKMDGTELPEELSQPSIRVTIQKT